MHRVEIFALVDQNPAHLHQFQNAEENGNQIGKRDGVREQFLHARFLFLLHVVENADDFDFHGNDRLCNHRRENRFFRLRSAFVGGNDAANRKAQACNLLVGNIGGVNRHLVGVLDHPPAVDLVKFRHFCGGFFCLLIPQQGFLQVHARVLFLFLRTGEKHFAFDADQFACHDDEIARQLHVQVLRRFDIGEVLVTDQGDRNVGDIHFVFLNQCEQQIEGTLEVELLQPVCDAFHVCTSEKIRLADS